jgi:hypothetical protein
MHTASLAKVLKALDPPAGTLLNPAESGESGSSQSGESLEFGESRSSQSDESLESDDGVAPDQRPSASLPRQSWFDRATDWMSWAVGSPLAQATYAGDPSLTFRADGRTDSHP